MEKMGWKKEQDYPYMLPVVCYDLMGVGVRGYKILFSSDIAILNGSIE